MLHIKKGIGSAAHIRNIVILRTILKRRRRTQTGASFEMSAVNLHSGGPSSGLSEANEASSDCAERPRLELRLSSEPSSSLESAERV